MTMAKGAQKRERMLSKPGMVEAEMRSMAEIPPEGWQKARSS